ncbi:DNA-directed RNA polymerase subunit beta' [Brachyspira murdochii]|uniref:DNA-directed RNA polymerase subunit beta' n=2 Tax=Brachyspira murdochii TaxID=84378 RepID=D5UBG4_BRAM5|nr:DNA-directed RNA polymerase subunit beta' [Brachyspira murdochii]ADG72037.1 DNA-directed RNA polymerase, beta' subunit [Brachyspira murdochii DSM 12563]PPS23095.1 DNA-directed RNA polymerase subunit beta' [Brachyspira murdochii]
MQFSNFDQIKISIASPQVMREWSYGEVKKPETINYRTLRPERDGLFCEKIFGTTKEYECYCGKFKSIRYKGVVCDKCGVEVTHFKVRRERMGHIELAAPVAHIWYYRNTPSRIGLLLNMNIAHLRSVLYFERYVVIDAGDSAYSKGDLLTEDEYNEALDRYGDNIRIGIGAEGIRDMLKDLDMDEEIRKLREEMIKKGEKSDRRLRKRLEIFEDFKASGNDPTWMILDVVPVIPPDLRPMVQLDGGRFATSDLNDLYRRVINRNIRLRRLLVLRAPDIIIRNEKRMLQEAVDALFDNSRRKKVVKGPGNRPLKSLSDMLKGKQGRFRQNLLGKRVDYSGRSVIVAGPRLKMHQCGLPKKMAVELFKPFIMKKLVEINSAHNIKSAKRFVEEGREEVWGVLEEIAKEHPVLLNRAPTLHRLGIQAFEPVLVEGKAIQLHPLVCHAYNADFDGDQMAVHTPLSAEAQIEAWTLMLAPHNILNPANGEPIVNPTQDIVLGISYLTKLRTGIKGEGKMFSSPKDALLAYDNDLVELEARIKVLMKNKDGEEQFLETSVGRLKFNEVIPEDFRFQNRDFNSKDLAKFIHEVYLKHGTAVTVNMLDDIKELGYKSATVFASTISIADILIPPMKKHEIEEATKQVEFIENQYQNGVITTDEKKQKVIDLWTTVEGKITEAMMDNLRQDQDGFNPVYIMADSGARGSKQQIRQLASMRGLMAKPSGEIIELPIISNFKEGLTVQEYFISTHGARKGLADTALKTSNAGYLTRRLVDVAIGVVVSEHDCGTVKGIEIEAIKSGDEIIDPLKNRIVGFFSNEYIYHPVTKELICPANTEITEEIGDIIEKAGIEKIRIRHPLTCESRMGVCQKCYGRSLSTNNLASIGEAVGVVAAQSIGQPGTQLTMRTFHIGGVATQMVEENEVKVNYPIYIEQFSNYVVQPNGVKITARKGDLVIRRVLEKFEKNTIKELLVENNSKVLIGDVIANTKDGSEIKATHNGTLIVTDDDKYVMITGVKHSLAIKVGSEYKVDEHVFIEPNTVIASFDTYNEPIISEKSGIVRWQDIIPGRTLVESIDEQTGNVTNIIQEFKDASMQPKILITGEGDPFETDIPNGAQLMVENNQKVEIGEVIAKTTRIQQKSRDITGGLPRVQELLEAQKPKDTAIIAGIDGEVEIGGSHKGKKVVKIRNEFDETKHLVPHGKMLLVRNGDYVKTGTQLCAGKINPHDILETQGDLALQTYLLEEIQGVYKQQGVGINDKHFALIIRQMLRRLEITDPGDTKYIVGQYVDKYEFEEENKRYEEAGGSPASGKPVLLGLTKAALNTESFISSASFQETTKVLTNAAIKGKVDKLLGLKENVIIGHLIPAGTGVKLYNKLHVYNKHSGDLDKKDNVETTDKEEEVMKITV